MGNRKKLGKDRTVHARMVEGTSIALCTRSKTRRTTDDPEAVTCEACGKAAVAYLKAAAEQAEAEHRGTVLGRQEAALAAAQPPRWWETRPGAGEPGERG